MTDTNHLRRTVLKAAGGILLASALPRTLLAQTAAAPTTGGFPNKPLRIVVPYPPGGATDVLARVLAEKMAPRLGQPVVVDNKPGASGNIAADAVAKAKPTGSKGTYIQRIAVTSTMGPGVKVEPSTVLTA